MVSRRRARSRVFTLLGATALLGLASMPLARLFGEPYPWLSMPGFHGNGGFDGSAVRAVEPVFTFRLDDDDTRALSAPQLFADVGSSYVRKLASRFDLEPAGRPRLQHWLPGRLFPGLDHAGREPLDLHDPELFAWFRRRLQAFYPDAVPVAVTVTFRERMFDARGEHEYAVDAPTRRFSP